MFLATLFVILQLKKQLNYPSTGEWVYQLWQSHRTELRKKKKGTNDTYSIVEESHNNYSEIKKPNFKKHMIFIYIKS